MTDSANKDLRLVCLAALAWLHEHDYPGEHAGGMDAEIDPAELASAIEPKPTRAVSGSGKGDRPRKIVVCHPDNYKAIQAAVTREMGHTDVLVQMNRWIDPGTTYVFDGALLDASSLFGPKTAGPG